MPHRIEAALRVFVLSLLALHFLSIISYSFLSIKSGMGANCIRAELSKGTITREFATAAKEIADELKTLAIHGDEYTAEQFKKDMTREALYALTDKRLNQRK